MRNRIFLLWLLMVWGAGAVNAQCTLVFSGHVEDEDLHTPLEGAAVKIPALRLVAYTNSKGLFSLQGICPGEYDVEVSHVGCQPQSIHIHVEQKDLHLEIVLPHQDNALEDVVVTAQAVPGRKTGATSLRGAALVATRGESLAESLTRINGVAMLQTGTNIYKPVINGLHSNRVLMLNNGIRHEGQQWGSEHAPEIDPFIANRLTVIRGAGTLRYGHDGLGGVILVEPHLLPAKAGVRGEVNTGFFTNQRMGFLSGMVEGNSERHPAFGWRLQGTVRRGGNARTPEYFLDNSGLQETNFSAAAGLQKSNRGLEVFYSFFSTKLGIFSGSHIGNLTDLMEIIKTGQPPVFYREKPFSYDIGRPFQQVSHHLLKVKAFSLTGEKGRFNVLASWQYNRRKEYDVKRFASSSDKPGLDIGLLTGSTDLVWDHFGSGPLRGTIGLTAQYQQNLYYERFFIPNYQAFNAGFFAIEKYQKGKWQLEAGLRYDNRQLFAIDRNNGAGFPDKSFAGLSGSFSALFSLNNHWWFSLQGSSAWRAPTINELYSDGLHHGAARLEKGNPDLTAERANGLMATVGWKKKHIELELSSSYKLIDGFIYLKPTFPPQLTIRGAFPTFEYDQTDARFTSVDLSFGWLPNAHWRYDLKASIVRAWDRTAEDWLIQIPPDRFDHSITYQFGDRANWQGTYVKLMAHMVLEQTRVPGTGNIEITKPDGSISMESDYAPPPPGYLLPGLEAGTGTNIWGRPIRMTLTGSNLSNTVYRNYMNAFRYYADEMGINVGFKVQVMLGKHS